MQDGHYGSSGNGGVAFATVNSVNWHLNARLEMEGSFFRFFQRLRSCRL